MPNPIKHMTRRNGCYHKGLGRTNRPKRWRKAVASHPKGDANNPDALSRFIPNEVFLDHEERKSFKLPCGKTLAESWGGLRKSWLGFKIAHSNKDNKKMTHYASFITKVQTQMGIQVTQFDSDILDKQEMYKANKGTYGDQIAEETAVQEERVPDYDSIMDDARSRMNDKSEAVAVPRDDIFNKSMKTGKNSCKYIPQNIKDKTAAKIDSWTNHASRANEYPMSQEKTYQPWQVETSQTRDGYEQKEDEVQNSCYYQRSDNGNVVDVQNDVETLQSRYQDEVDEVADEVQNSCFYQRSDNVDHDQPRKLHTKDENSYYYGTQNEMPAEADENETKRSKRRSCYYKSNG